MHTASHVTQDNPGNLCQQHLSVQASSLVNTPFLTTSRVRRFPSAHSVSCGFQCCSYRTLRQSNTHFGCFSHVTAHSHGARMPGTQHCVDCWEHGARGVIPSFSRSWSPVESGVLAPVVAQACPLTTRSKYNWKQMLLRKSPN